MNRSPRLLPRLAAGAALTLALGLAACGGDDDAADDEVADTSASPSSPAAAPASTTGAATTATADIPDGLSLTVAEQAGGQSIAWELADAGADLPYDVEFADFNGGTAVIEAVLAGAADLGDVGEAPLPIAVSNGADDLVVVAMEANPGSSGNYYLVAQPDSGITTVEDLAGRKVAYPPGTGRHMIVAAILADAGLSVDGDVEAVELAGSEVAPAFAAGAVDAAMVLGYQYYGLGEPPILDDGTGYNTGINALIVRRDTLEDPARVAAIGDYVRRAVAANNAVQLDPDPWIEASYVEQQGLTFEQGKELVDEAGLGSYYPIDDAATALFQQVADGLLETGGVSRPVDIAEHLDPRFNDVITAQNDADGIEPAALAPDRTQGDTMTLIANPEGTANPEGAANPGGTDGTAGAPCAAADIEVLPVAGWIGAEVRGVDLTAPLGPDVTATLRTAWLRWRVLFFRDQHLDHAAHERFARAFGAPTPAHPLFDAVADPEHPAIYPVHRDRFEARYETRGYDKPGWHADVTAALNPPAASILRAEVVPPYGGDTMWSNTVAAYEGLSPSVQRLVEGLRAVHRFALPDTATDDYRRRLRERPLLTEHPVVRVHPETGERALYVSPSFTSHIVGVSPHESRALLGLLYEQLVRPEYTVRFRWEPGSIAFWDNRSTVHLAPNDLDRTDHDRRLYRVTLVGDVPVGPDGQPSVALEGAPFDAL